jgi:hypothetical protein
MSVAPASFAKAATHEVDATTFGPCASATDVSADSFELDPQDAMIMVRAATATPNNFFVDAFMYSSNELGVGFSTDNEADHI